MLFSRLSLRLPAALALGFATLLRADDAPVPPAAVDAASFRADHFTAVFRPFRTEGAAISPDGKYVAYSYRSADKLNLAIVDLADPKKIKAAVQVADDASSTEMLANQQRESTVAQITWLRWVTPTRIAVETNRIFPGPPDATGQWTAQSGAIFALDADGSNARLILQPSDAPEISPNFSGANPFSINRDRSTKIRQTWDVSLPAGLATTQKVPDFLAASPAAADVDAPAIDPATGNLLSLSPPTGDMALPRALHVFDLDPDRPGSLRVMLTGGPRDFGSRRIEFYSVDVASRKLTSLHDDVALNTHDTLLDRQGRIRSVISNTSLSSFPLRYVYRGTGIFTRDRPLEEATGINGFAVSPANFFGARAIPLGFDADPDVLYYASNLDRDTYGIYSVNLATKQRGALALENATYDLVSAPTSGFSGNDALIYDPHTHHLAGVRYEGAQRSVAWLQPKLRGAQEYFEKFFPGRSIDLLDWDQAEKRFIVSTSGPADAGGLYLFDSESSRLLELARHAPWLDGQRTHVTLPFSYLGGGGNRIHGLVTIPSHPRLKPVPVVLLCPDWPWNRARSTYTPEVQSLADLGFAVVQLDVRGAWGFGLEQRAALAAGYDLIQVEDLADSLANLNRMFQINVDRVALLGIGHGGFTALRTLQDHPDRFRCAIAIESPVNLRAWLGEQWWSGDNLQATLTKAWLGDDARLRAAPLVSRPEQIKKPVLLLNYAGPAGAPRTGTYLAARYFAQAVRDHGGSAQLIDLPLDYTRRLPQARAEAFAQIADFLNETIYDFKVKMGDLKVKSDASEKKP